MRGTFREHAYHAVLWLVALVFFAPIAWIILSSFKTADQILDNLIRYLQRINDSRH